MKKLLIIAFSMSLFACSSVNQNKTLSENNINTLTNNDADLEKRLSTAKKHLREADKIAKEWSRNAYFVQMDAWNVSSTGKVRNPNGAWAYYYIDPIYRRNSYAVVFKSDGTKPYGKLMPISNVYSQIKIGREWKIDTPAAMKTAKIWEFSSFPAQQVRLSYWNNLLIWQIYNETPKEERIIIDARTGEKLNINLNNHEVLENKSLESLNN